MFQASIDQHDDLDRFRQLLRHLLAHNVVPDEVLWTDGTAAALLPSIEPGGAAPVMLPAGFKELAEWVICHRDEARLDRLYRLAWRITHGEKALLHDAADPLVHTLTAMRKAVSRDRHKMTAFVRFRRVGDEADPLFVAWFEPEHHILRHVAPFFADRFADMRWIIMTPKGSIAWDRAALRLGPPARRSEAPDGDPLDEWWQSYYAATFNPARANLEAMLTELPKRYWHNLPEAKMIPTLLAQARDRQDSMLARAGEPVRVSKEHAVPADPEVETNTLEGLAKAEQACTRCPLHSHATQAVPGKGAADAELVLIGEQPGDQEDLAGLPFVGPAGQVLDRALVEAGLDRRRLYITNAVKHFKFEPRGKRRIHQKPNNAEIDQCRWWLDRELAIVRPRVIVALGATAARTLLGRTVTIGRERGHFSDFGEGQKLLVTVHPSYLLRLPDEAAKREELAKFTADLALAAGAVPKARLVA